MPTERPHFDPVSCPLNGTTVVEAGAGTGKTYSIAELYIRLLLEGDVPLTTDQILVVTYTNAATAELRKRLRQRIEEARKASDDPATDDRVVKKLKASGLDPATLKKRCAAALAAFDQAPVSTIHGFCQKMLNENAFESGIRYGKELRTDISEMLTGFYYDFFRRNNYLVFPERTAFWQRLGLTPQSLLDSTRNLLGHDKDQAIVWDENGDEEELQPLEIALQEAEDNKEKTYALHPTNKRKAEDISARRAADQALSHARSAYAQAVRKLARKYVGQKLAEAKDRENFMTFDDLLINLKQRLEDPQDGPKLREVIRKRFKYAIVDEFQDTDDIQNAIFQKLFNETDSDPTRGFFMIGDPKQAIYAFRGGDIFTYLQATGIVAADRKPQLTTNYRSSTEFIQVLNNLRTLQGREDAFFHNDAIDFPEIGVPEQEAKQLHLLVDGVPAPASAHLLSRCTREGDKLLQDLASEIQAMVGNPHLRLDDKDEKRQDKSVQYGDIAVLVRNNHAGTDIAAYLRAQGIPCVQQYDQSIYATPEAQAMLGLMETLQNLAYQPRRSLFLDSCFFCLSPKNIVALSNQENRFPQALLELRQLWEKKSFLAMFRAFQQKSLDDLLGQGAVQALRLNGAQTVAQSIIANGRRSGNHTSLACFQQLQETIHQAALEQRLGLGGLAEFLRKQIAASRIGEVPAENTLRLMSQDSAVTIMTIHKSKGLQFPIVFVVGMMNAETKTRDGGKFHLADGRNGLQARYNMTSDAESTAHLQADKENFQELVRLFYVAVTRAKFLCRLLDRPSVPKKGHNPFLLQFLPQQDEAGNVAENACLPSLSTEEQLAWLHPEGNGTLPPAVSAVRAELFDGKHTPMPAGWRTCSYSALSTGKTAENPQAPSAAIFDSAEQPMPSLADDERMDIEDNDEDTEEAHHAPVRLAPIFRFPRGAQAGLCWHEILEKIDFTLPVAQQEPLYRNLLKTHAQLSQNDQERQERLDAFAQMLEGLLHTPLPDPQDPGRSLPFALKDIDFGHRSSELEFKYRLRNGFSSQALFGNSPEIRLPAQWFRDYRPESQWTLNGCLDLLFQAPDGKYYIADWKTNSLNRTFEAFDRQGMQAEMDAHFYTLQYLLYTTAFLHAYQQLNPDWALTPESYDRLFGGVFYFFVRGIRPGQPGANGFYATRPSFGLAQRFFQHLTV